ncbi:MAG TPA: hypothetical protein PKE69_00690 [Pyrinomonadaceae bacterium]|nr:hypothetical protein [Pyrinomonadaceae bacterium]
MVHIWTQTIVQTIDSPATREMRYSRSLSAELCANFENTNYQPKTVGLDRLGRKN